MSEAGRGEAGGEKMTKQEEKRREEQRQESWNQGCTFLKTFFFDVFLNMSMGCDMSKKSCMLSFRGATT